MLLQSEPGSRVGNHCFRKEVQKRTGALVSLEGGSVAYLDGTHSDFLGKAAARRTLLNNSRTAQGGTGQRHAGRSEGKDFRNRMKAKEDVKGLSMGYGACSPCMEEGCGCGASPSSAGTSQ